MIRGESEVRIQLSDDYNDAELIWTFKTDSREEFIKKATQAWDWFMNDDPYLGGPSPLADVVELRKTETED